MRSTWGRATVPVLAVLFLAGCAGAHPGSEVFAPPRTVSLDGGALVLVPVPGAAPHVGRAYAARVVAAVQMVGSGGLTPVLARVTADLPGPVTGPSSELVGRLQLPLAWVYLQRQPKDGMACSGPYIRPSPPPATASDTWAVIVDASTGTSYVYTGAGAGFCVPGPAPVLRRGYWLVSVPFTLVKQAPLRYKERSQMPPCGRTFSMTLGTHLSMTTVLVPTGPCHGRAATRVDIIFGRVHEQPHARLGVVCFANYDARYGKPSDCVSMG